MGVGEKRESNNSKLTRQRVFLLKGKTHKTGMGSNLKEWSMGRREGRAGLDHGLLGTQKSCSNLVQPPKGPWLKEVPNHTSQVQTLELRGMPHLSLSFL